MRFQTPVLLFAPLFLTAPALANCEIAIPEKTFAHSSGISIRFDFEKLLHEKKYQEVEHPEDGTRILALEGIEKEGDHFHHAFAAFYVGKRDELPLEASADVRCYTQNCSLSDYGKAFRKAFQVLFKKLPECQE